MSTSDAPENLEFRSEKHGKFIVVTPLSKEITYRVSKAFLSEVKKLVDGFISPIVQFIVGSQDALNSAVWHVELFGRKADFAWGAFVSSAITLIATAFVIYLIIHYAKLDRLDKKKD